MSLPDRVELVGSPLIQLNGGFEFDYEQGFYVHSAGYLHMFHKNGKWSIVDAGSKAEYAASSNESEDICALKWKYFSKNKGKDMVSKNMRLVRVDGARQETPEMTPPDTPSAKKQAPAVKVVKTYEMSNADAAPRADASEKQGTEKLNVTAPSPVESTSPSNKTATRRRSVPPPPATPNPGIHTSGAVQLAEPLAPDISAARTEKAGPSRTPTSSMESAESATAGEAQAERGEAESITPAATAEAAVSESVELAVEPIQDSAAGPAENLTLREDPKVVPATPTEQAAQEEAEKYAEEASAQEEAVVESISESNACETDGAAGDVAPDTDPEAVQDAVQDADPATENAVQEAVPDIAQEADPASEEDIQGAALDTASPEGGERSDGSDGDPDGFVHVHSPSKGQMQAAIATAATEPTAAAQAPAGSPDRESEAAAHVEPESAKEVWEAEEEAEEENQEEKNHEEDEVAPHAAFADCETTPPAVAASAYFVSEEESAAVVAALHALDAPGAPDYSEGYDEDQEYEETDGAMGPVLMSPAGLDSELDSELAGVHTGPEEEAEEEEEEEEEEEAGKSAPAETRDKRESESDGGDDRIKERNVLPSDDADEPDVTVPASAQPFGFPYTNPHPNTEIKEPQAAPLPASPPKPAQAAPLPASPPKPAQAAPLPASPQAPAAPFVPRPPAQPAPYTVPSPNKPGARPVPAPAPAASAVPSPATHSAPAPAPKAAAVPLPVTHVAPVPSPKPVMAPLPKYTRQIPKLASTAFSTDWEKVIRQDYLSFSTTVQYHNRITGEIRSESEGLPSFRPNIVSYRLDVAKVNLEVFAPTRCAQELNKQIISAAVVDELAPLEEYWTSTIASYEHTIGILQYYLKHFRANAETDFADKEVALKARIETLEAELRSVKEKEKLSEQRANNLMSRVGKSHIKRDWQQTRVQSAFPAGEDVRTEFQTAFMNFESFACDAVNCYEDLGTEDPPSALVNQVMTPIYTVTKKFIEGKLRAKKELLETVFGTMLPGEDVATDESVPRLFWYQTQQVQFPAEVDALTEADIQEMTGRMGSWVTDLTTEMASAAAAGAIDNGEQNLRIPHIVRHFLRLHTIAMLSDPCCYLHPAPGASTVYREGHCVEILSPGTKKYGRIKEGDVVEVVLCGLYFENPGNFPESDPKPVMPCLVRRLVTAAPVR